MSDQSGSRPVQSGGVAGDGGARGGAALRTLGSMAAWHLIQARTDGESRVKVLIVDDHVLFREGMLSLLSTVPDFSVVGQASTVQEAVSLSRDLQPDLVLMDIGLPDGSGLDALKAIIAHRPETAVVMLTIYEGDDFLFEAIRSGARGYLLKGTPFDKLVAALRRAHHGESVLSREMASRVVREFQRLGSYVQADPSTISVLTARELEVLRHIAMGASNSEIAEQLYISEHTVKVHVHNIFDKLQVKNRAQAAGFARRYGLEKRPTEPPVSAAV
jgi:DNA-binding NarL/FixJ family response regulator